MIPMTPQQWVNFWKKIDLNESSDCWEWLGGCRDFPTVVVASDSISVRHIIINNERSTKDEYLQMCGVKSCVAPDHNELPADSYLGGKTSLATPSLSSGGGVVSDPTQQRKSEMKTQIAAIGLAAAAMTGCTVQMAPEAPATNNAAPAPTQSSTKSSTETYYDGILNAAWSEQSSSSRSTFCSGFHEYPYLAASAIVGDGTDFPGLTESQVVDFFNEKCRSY